MSLQMGWEASYLKAYIPKQIKLPMKEAEVLVPVLVWKPIRPIVQPL